MASAMARAVDIGVHNAQPGGLLQGKELIDCGSRYPVENWGRACGESGSQDLGLIGYKLKGSIKGGSSYPVDPVCPRRSYLDNFGPLYRANRIPDHRSEKASDVSPASGQPTEEHKLECPSDKYDGDACGDAVRVVLNVTEEPTLARFFLAPYADHAPVSSTGSSIRGVENLLLGYSEGDHELTSTFQPLLATSDTPASQLFFPWGTSKGHLLRSSRGDEGARRNQIEFRFQVTPAHESSTRSSQDSCQAGPPQSPSRKQSSRYLKGKQKALEDGWDGSTSLSSQQFRKRLRPRTERLVPVKILSPILESRFRDPSCERDLDELKRHCLADITGDFDSMRGCRYETQCKRAAPRAEGYHRMRMRTLPKESIVKTQEAMSKPLALLHKWHFRLGLDNSNCPTAASRIFDRGFRNFQRSAWPIAIRKYRLRVRVLLAAALWVAAKAMEDSSRVPGASQMAEAAGVDVQSLTHTELPLLDSLQWKLLCGH